MIIVIRSHHIRPKYDDWLDPEYQLLSSEVNSEGARPEQTIIPDWSRWLHSILWWIRGTSFLHISQLRAVRATTFHGRAGRTEGMPAVPGLAGVSRESDSREGGPVTLSHCHTGITVNTPHYKHGQVQPDQPDHVCLQVSEAQQRGLHQTGPVSARLSGLRHGARALREKW